MLSASEKKDSEVSVDEIHSTEVSFIRHIAFNVGFFFPFLYILRRIDAYEGLFVLSTSIYLFPL
jgi:hypothetical protein